MGDFLLPCNLFLLSQESTSSRARWIIATDEFLLTLNGLLDGPFSRHLFFRDLYRFRKNWKVFFFLLPLMLTPAVDLGFWSSISPVPFFLSVMY